MLALAGMGRWRIESDPGAEAGGPPGRYLVYRDTDATPLLALDAGEAAELTEALLAELAPPGYRIEERGDRPPRQVGLRAERGQIEVTAGTGATTMARHEALGLVAVLAAELGRQPEDEASSLAWQCAVCKATSSAAPGQRPGLAGCGGWKRHRWVPAGAVYFASTLQAALPAGQKTAIVRDADAEARRSTACRVDARHGDMVGVVLITDGYAMGASLDSIAEQVMRAAEELGRLRQRRQEDTHLVFVGENGVRLARR